MKYLLVLILLVISYPAWGYVDPSLDTKTTALANYLEASQGNQINVGALRTTQYGGDLEFPTVGVKQPKMQTHEAMKDYNLYPTSTMLWGGTTQRLKLTSNYALGTTIVMLSFNPFNPVTGGNFPDRTGDPIHNIRVGDPYRAQWLANLNDLVTELQLLNSQGIPVILRLPQENNCPWDWWGKSTDATHGASAAEYVTLMREIVDYIKAAGVHNVLYGYSPDFNSNASCSEQTTIDGSWYPGNSYVDVIMASLYINASDFLDTTRLSTNYAAMAAAASRTGKIWGISEGPIDFTLGSVSSYAPTFWTWYFDFILADANAKNAAFINFWGTPKWYSVPGRADFFNLRQAQRDPKYSRFVWGFGDTRAMNIKNVKLNGVNIK